MIYERTDSNSNFQDEQSLTKENKKQLHKMMKYVRTFPLQDLEIETIRRDLLGMALEAQTRGSSLQSSLGKKPRDFCDDIAPAGGNFCASPAAITRLSVQWV